MATVSRRSNLGRDILSRRVPEKLAYCTAPCAFGVFVAASSGRGLVSLLLGDHPAGLVGELQARVPRAEFAEKVDDARTSLTNLTRFVDYPAGGLSLPLDLRGTDFQLSVWQALRTIAPGETVTYAELAQLLGAPGAVRAVAGACAANHLAVAIPCHRVV